MNYSLEKLPNELGREIRKRLEVKTVISKRESKERQARKQEPERLRRKERPERKERRNRERKCKEGRTGAGAPGGASCGRWA